MGGYYGHIISGVILTLYGVLWTVLSIANYFYEERLKSDHKRWKENGHVGRQHRPRRLLDRGWQTAMDNYAWLPFPCIPRLPIEPIAKAAISGFGLLVELCIEIDRKDKLYWRFANLTRHPVNPEKVQHATMWAFYILSGTIDLVVYFGCCKMPKKAGRVVFALSYAVQAGIFFMHNTVTTALDHRMHLIIALGALACAVAAAWRITKERDLFANLFLSTFMTFQGTWLIQTASTLWTNIHLWEPDSMWDVMYISVIAFWHLFFLVVFVFVLWFAIWLVSFVLIPRLPEMPCVQKLIAKCPSRRCPPDKSETEPMMADEQDLDTLA